MHITNQQSSNTFIFTEKDLPGYASKGKGDARKGQNNGTYSSTQITGRTFRDRSKIDKNKRWQPSFRKAIPSKSSLPILRWKIDMVSYRTDRFGRPGSNRDQLLARREHRISATDGLEEQRGHETEKGNKVSGRNCSWSWRRESWNVGINWKLPYIHCEFHGKSHGGVSTDVCRKLVGLDEGRLKRLKLLECLRMSSWTCSMNASRNTGTGRSKVSSKS